MQVQILSKKLITPSSATPPHLKNLKISCLDQLSPPDYVICIFYYPANAEERGVNVNRAQKSKQLQKSLSETLTLFYPLGGRYIKDQLLIDCNDKGAEYLEAKVSTHLSQLLKEDVKIELLNNLVQRPSESNDSPLVVVQFNMFDCGGVAIGVCVSHRIADGFTVFSFIDAWATVSRIGNDKVHCQPSFQLASFCPSRDMPAANKFAIKRRVETVKIVVKRFVFNGASISNLKALANAGLSDSELLKRQPTRVEVVAALIWSTLIKASEARHGNLRPSLLTIPVDMRGRSGLSIPEHSCGNFFGLAIAQFVPDNENKVQLHDLVCRIHNAITSISDDYAKASNGDELFSVVTNSFRKIVEARQKSELDVHVVGSWCRFPMYEADFGWGGRPSWVSPVFGPKEVVGLMDTKDGGIEAWVSLNENSMLHFEQNPDIKALTCQELQLHLADS